MESQDEIRTLIEWSGQYLSIYPEFFSEAERKTFEGRIREVNARYAEYLRELSRLVAHDFATLKLQTDKREVISKDVCDVYCDLKWIVDRKNEQAASQQF